MSRIRSRNRISARCNESDPDEAKRHLVASGMISIRGFLKFIMPYFNYRCMAQVEWFWGWGQNRELSWESRSKPLAQIDSFILNSDWCRTKVRTLVYALEALEAIFLGELWPSGRRLSTSILHTIFMCNFSSNAFPKAFTDGHTSSVPRGYYWRELYHHKLISKFNSTNYCRVS